MRSQPSLAASIPYAPTPLLNLPALAERLGVAQVLAKDEGRRMLGSFKSLGGTYAGLRALARASRMQLADLLAARPKGQPTLVCASDGNHGLAVAAAARFAGAPARVFLHESVPKARARRIENQGAEIVWVPGTYDNAVDAAAAAACQGAGILVADTTDDPNDPSFATSWRGTASRRRKSAIRWISPALGVRHTSLYKLGSADSPLPSPRASRAGWHLRAAS